MDRRLVLEYVRVTEAAAVACARLVGHGKKEEADARAVEAMRRAFDRVPAQGRVVIGEGEMDEAPMLFIGEEVGPRDPSLPEVDIAVDPLEGTNLVAKGMPGALAVIAVAPKGQLLNAPDCYMHKIACGPPGVGVVHLDKSPYDNVCAYAEAAGKPTSNVVVVTLDRPRHQEIIEGVRKAGGSVRLISDGDVNPCVAAGIEDSGVDMFMGIGGAPEGVLAAAALRCLGGEFQARLRFVKEGERERAASMGLEDPDALLTHEQLCGDDVIFVASGVTDGPLLPGVRYIGEKARVRSIVARSQTGTVRWVDTVRSAPKS